MKKTNKTTIVFTMLTVFVLLIAGCSEITKPKELTIPTPSSTQTLSGDINIKNFQTDQEFKEFIEQNQYSIYGHGIKLGLDTRSILEQSMDLAFAPTVNEAGNTIDGIGSRDFSETNVQVEGVDEMDIIKTDGNYIYTSTHNDVFVIKAYPAQDAEIISTITTNNSVTGLFIEENVLAVAGTIWDIDELRKIGFSSYQGLTYLNLYDVSDKANPILLKEYRFDGSYFNARLYEGIIYISTNYNPYGRPIPLPIIMVDGIKRTMPVSDIYFYNIDYTSPSFVGIYSVEMKTQNKIDSKVITVEGANYMYMSYENIYITQQENINRYEMEQEIMMNKIIPRLPEIDMNLINRIKAVDDDILNKYEKQLKIMEVVRRYVMFLDKKEQEQIEEQVRKETKEELRKLKYLHYTIIHKINVDNGFLRFEEGNKVPGMIYGQFALDEHEGILRIATTIGQGMRETEEYSSYDWKTSSPSINNIYTLDENMNIIGKLEGLAPTESIFSARYVKNRLYLVTFEQIDPFFVIDLTDPLKPENLGELKITGFSRYLHPYDENTIIGLGREGTETGIIKGIKISLFDVTNVTNPKELVTYVSEDSGSSSVAEWEHKAFLFSKEKELLVIPMQTYDWRNPELNYAGALVFKINKQEIIPRGLIIHMAGQLDGQGVERSLYIENKLYTKSPNLLRINNIEDLESIKNITLSTTKQGNIPIY